MSTSSAAAVSRPSPRTFPPQPTGIAAPTEVAGSAGSRPVVVSSSDEALQQHFLQCKAQHTAAFRIASWAQRVHAALLPRFVTTATTASVLVVALLMWI